MISNKIKGFVFETQFKRGYLGQYFTLIFNSNPNNFIF